MKREERFESLMEALLLAFRGFQSGLWTAMPAQIVSFDAAKLTVSAQPTIQAQVTQPDGSKVWTTLPMLVDVPVIFPGGGGFTLTFPVKSGDEALIIFASRCIDNWWYLGQVQTQGELRMHDLSDGFALIGVRSLPRAISSVSTTGAQLRADDGSCSVEIAPSGVVNVNAVNVNVVASGEVMMTTPDLKVTGDITAFEGTIHEFSIGTLRTTYNNHKHTGVQTGGGTSGNPTNSIP